MATPIQSSDKGNPGEPGKTVPASSVGEFTPQIYLEPAILSSEDSRHHRWRILDEFIENERSYIRSLQFLIYDLLLNLKKNNVVLERSKLQDMFAYLPEIRVLHQHFRNWMELTATSWAEKEMAGWIFGAVLEQPVLVKAYSMFVIKYKDARVTIKKEVAANASFRAFLNDKMTQTGERLDLEALIFKPFQRMIHMKVQVERLIGCTSLDHPDKHMLQMAFKRVKHILSHIDALERCNDLYRSMMKRAFPFGVPRAAYAHNWHQSQLLHFQELPVYDRKGDLQKIHRIVLLSDRVLYTAVVNDDVSSWFEAKQRLKWMLPLQKIEFQTISPNGLLHVPKADDVYMKMLQLIHDFAIVQKIGSLVSSLNHSIDGLSTPASGSILDKLNTEMQKLNDDAKVAEECYNSCQLMVSRQSKSFHRRRKYLIRFPDSASKRRWYCNARLAQRAMQSAPHTSVWWTDVDQLLATHEPVFVNKLSPGTFPDHSKLTCGTYFAPNLAAPLYVRQPLRDWLRNRRMLWICTFSGSDTTVTFYTHEVLSNTLVRRMHLLLNDAFVECVVHVPEGQVVLGDDSTVDTVWMGLRNLLKIYSGSYPLVDKQLVSVSIKGCPKQMVHRADRVYIGLDNGNVLIYQNGATAWNLHAALVVSVCAHPIATLLSIKGNIYVAAGTSVSVIDGKTDRLRVKINDQEEQGDGDAQALTSPIICMAYSVNGLWLVRHRSCVVSLYRLSPWKRLQDINICGPVLRFSQIISRAICETNLFITSLALIDFSLWIGTSVGITLLMALPMRRNVPLIGDFLYGAKHGHLRNVNMLLPLVPEADDLVDSCSEADDAGYDAYGLLRTDHEGVSTSSIYETTRTATETINELLTEQATSTGAKPKQPRAQGTTACCQSKRKSSSKVSDASTGTNLETPEKVFLAIEPNPSMDGTQVTHNSNCPTTVLILAGGEGYLNWHRKEAIESKPSPSGSRLRPFQSDFLDDKSSNSHILVWEKCLYRP